MPTWLVKTKKYLAQEKIILALILALTVFFYWPSLRGEFLYWDDNYQISENPDIKELSWANTAKIFHSFYLGMYQPLTTASYALNWHFWPDQPIAFHSTNLLLHLINIILVWLLFKKLNQPQGLRLLAAAWLAWQPLNVEAVAWLSARSGLLANATILGATISYLFYLEKNKRRWFWLSFVIFVLGVLSKSTAVIFPLIALAADYFVIDKKPKTLWHNLWIKTPFWLVSLFFGYLTIVARQQAGHITTLAGLYNLLDRLVLVFYSLSFYVVKFFLPLNLSPHYSYPLPINHHLPADVYLTAGLILIISGALIFLIIKKRLPKIALFGLTWFILNLILVLRIIPLGFQYATDRYNYLAALGLLLTLTTGFYNFRPSTPTFKKILTGGLILILLFFGCLSRARTYHWQNKIILLDEVIETMPAYGDAYFFRALAKKEKADLAGALDDFTLACYWAPQNLYFHEQRGLFLINFITFHRRQFYITFLFAGSSRLLFFVISSLSKNIKQAVELLENK